MRKLMPSLFALIAMTCIAPSALASEPWPPLGWERVIMYYSGSCDSTSKSVNGYFSVSCNRGQYADGTRSGKWRAITDTHCVNSAANDEYQVCTSGASCTTDNGTWVTISYEDWIAGNCP